MIKMIKRRFFTGIMLVCATLTVVAQKNMIDEVIWIVGDEAILRSDVEQERLFMQQNNSRFDGDPYCVIPEQIAINKLFLSQAKIDSIDADESQVIRQVDGWINNAVSMIGSKEKAEEYFGKKLAQLKEDQKVVVREQYIVGEMQKKIVGDIKLRPSDVTKYFNQIAKDSLPMIPTTVEVSVLMMEPRIPIEDVDAIKERLRDFTEQINSGATTFTILAIRYSEDKGTAGNGGETGFRSKMELAPEYATAAFALSDPNRVSNVIQTEYGYHILQLVEKKGDRINSRHILLRPRVSEQELDKAMVRLDSLLMDINAGKLTFEEATYFSSDKDTRNNNGLMVNQNPESRNVGTSKFEMQDLPLGMGVVVEKMEVGDISKPFIMKNNAQNDVVVIVKLNERINVHQANIKDDFQELKSYVENIKREDIIKDWIASKQKSTFIQIKDNWCNCEFQYPGWIKE